MAQSEGSVAMQTGWYAVAPPHDSFYVFIPGDPEPAGSPRIVTFNGRPAIRWQKGPKWTRAIRKYLREVIPEAARPVVAGPARGWLTFIMPKPHRPKFQVPATPPDLDKLERAVLDGMVDRDEDKKQQPLLIEDDARFISCVVEAMYGDPTGVHIYVWPA